MKYTQTSNCASFFPALCYRTIVTVLPHRIVIHTATHRDASPSLATHRNESHRNALSCVNAATHRNAPHRIASHRHANALLSIPHRIDTPTHCNALPCLALQRIASTRIESRRNALLSILQRIAKYRHASHRNSAQGIASQRIVRFEP